MSEFCPKCGSAYFGVREDDTCLSCGWHRVTVFSRITASPEVLAETIVYEECEHSILDTNGCGATFPGGYTSAILDFSYGTKAEAIAATVERLKEVENG